MYQVYGLKCVGLKNPKGITVKQPEFSWKLFSDEKGRAQQSYRIIVWNQDEQCVWDSGTINKSDVFGINYEGEPLKSHTAYQWQVITISNYKEQAVSEKASFTVGMLECEWKAFWIETGRKRQPKGRKQEWK